MDIHHKRAGQSQFEPAVIDRIIGAVTGTGRIRAKDTVTVTLVGNDGTRRRRSIDSRTALSERLWATAYDYMLARSNERCATPSEKVGYFDKIEKAADRLLAALLVPDDERPGSQRFPGEYWTSVAVPDLPYDSFDMVVAAQWIRAAAKAGKYGATAQVGARPPHSGDLAVQQLIRDLAVIYRDIFGRAAGATNDPYKQGKRGPFFRFCRACIQAITDSGDVAVDLTDGALDAYVQRLVEGTPN